MPKRLISMLITVSVFSVVGASDHAVAERVYVYKDYGYAKNSGIWASVMPAEAAETSIFGYKHSKPGVGGKGTAVRIVFDIGRWPWWVGLVASVKPSYFGEWEAEGLDLSKARKLVFYAKGEQGGERIQIKAAIAGDQPFGDSADQPVDTSWIELKGHWEKYEVSVDGKQLKRVITPFAVIANIDMNPGGRIVFYVDEIYYE